MSQSFIQKHKRFLKACSASIILMTLVFVSFFIGLGFNGLIHIEAKGTIILQQNTGCYINTDQNITYIAQPGYIYANQNFFINICHMKPTNNYQLQIDYFSTQGPSITSQHLRTLQLQSAQDTYYIAVVDLLQNITITPYSSNLQFVLLDTSSIIAIGYSVLVPWNTTLQVGL